MQRGKGDAQVPMPESTAPRGAAATAGEPTISTRPFGKTPDGAAVDLYTLVNSQGMRAAITNYGGIIVALEVPDRSGKLDDVVLGYDTLDEYIAGARYFFGAIVGRYANRIGHGKFPLGGRQVVLACNSGPHHLHGGPKGFDKVVWDAKGAINSRRIQLVLEHVSPDGHEGYPGNLSVTVTYSLAADDNALTIKYRATTDKPTIVNLSSHGYFNLAGPSAGDVLGHQLTIHADRFLPADQDLLPTGEIRAVAGTPMDFTRPRAIGDRVDQDDDQLKVNLGYNHTWVLNQGDGPLSLAAEVHEPNSGRVLEVFTSEPGVHFYSGNRLDGSSRGKNGKVHEHRGGLCLETQHFPDSPNKPDFPSPVLTPGQQYSSATVYRFSAK